MPIPTTRCVSRAASALLLAAFAIPLQRPDGWETLVFGRVPANQVTFSEVGLHIRVDRSAGPLVFPLPASRLVRRVQASGRVRGAVRLEPGQRQGQRGADDYVLRIGLVEAGSRTLGRFERLTAPAWVRRLFALAPPHTGISQVSFYNVANATSSIGTMRQHPLSDLLHEQVVAAVDASGAFHIDHDFGTERRVLAVWLSSDGDDTQSSFEVTLERLELE